jgi:hypothetical protein
MLSKIIGKCDYRQLMQGAPPEVRYSSAAMAPEQHGAISIAHRCWLDHLHICSITEQVKYSVRSMVQ